MIRLSSLCPAYLFSFRFVRLLKLALPRDLDALNWPGMSGDVLSSVFGRVLTRQFPAHGCHRLALGRFRYPHAVGTRGLAAVLDYLSARKGTTIDPMRALGYRVSLNHRLRFVDNGDRK